MSDIPEKGTYIDTQGMSGPSDPNVPTRPIEEQQDNLKPAIITPRRLFTPTYAMELKILINEVLDEREYQKRLNGSYDNIKELPPSYFESEEFKYPVGGEEPPYEDWTQPWD